MLIYSVESLFEQAARCKRLSRQEELACARSMAQGDEGAREQLICSYLPSVAGHIRRLPTNLQTLSMALHCVQALEKCVDSFNFQQNSEPFSHRLSWALRNATTKYIAR